MADTAHTQHKIVVPVSVPMVGLLGTGDELLRTVERTFPATDILARGNEITVSGPAAEVALLERLFDELVVVLRTGQALTPDSVERSVAMLRADTLERPADVLTADILSNRGRSIRPKTLNQKRYVDAIDRHTVNFGIGPAGTGKTYLAVAKAVQALQTKQVSRIILTRPAVEAGERLGFLPGTLYEKIDPYLRPLYDALRDMLDPETVPRLLTDGVIEVAPLAYMRGRAQPVTTRVLTPVGFRPIGELTVGDMVIGSNGRPTPVLGVYPQGEKEIFRLATQDGASTLASGDHLWAVAIRDDRRGGKAYRVLTTTDMIGDLRAAHHRRYELPLLSGPAQFPPRDVPTDPYALGVLLGAGCLTGAAPPAGSGRSLVPRPLPGGGVATIADPVTSAPNRPPGPCGAGSAPRFVPDAYLHNTPDIRLAVLQGLLDSGGGSVKQADGACRIRYSTTSPRLRDDILFLVRSLGGLACWRPRPAAGRRPGRAKGRPVPHRNDAYVVDIRLPAHVEPFRLARKADSYRKAGGDGHPVRLVRSIEPAGRAQAVCIQVAAADSLYVTEDFLLTHNTLNDAFIILDEAQNTSAEQMKMFLTRLGFGSKIVVTGDVTQIDLPSGTSSGLKVVQEILEGIRDVHFSWLTSSDVVRHRLVSDIVDAYGRWDAARAHDSAGGTRRAGGRR